MAIHIDELAIVRPLINGDKTSAQLFSYWPWSEADFSASLEHLRERGVIVRIANKWRLDRERLANPLEGLKTS